jgi:hypothetical protein
MCVLSYRELNCFKCEQISFLLGCFICQFLDEKIDTNSNQNEEYHLLGYDTLQNHRCENLKSYTVTKMLYNETRVSSTYIVMDLYM